MDQLRVFARYNAWANTRLFDACAALPDGEYEKPRPAFFGGLHGTLNHILVGDRAWIGRLKGVPTDIPALDTELYPICRHYAPRAETEDRGLVTLVDGMTAADLDEIVEYQSYTAGPDRRSRRWILVHMFNHQTHHRGQAHGLLTHAGADPPPLDLIYFLRESGLE